MALIRIEGPAVEPVSLDEMRAHLRVDYDDEDALIRGYISAARQRLEKRCGRAFVQQTWELQTCEFEDSFEIPKPPTVSITSVTYLDRDQVEQTVGSANYALVNGGDWASSLILVGSAWPSDLAERPDAVRIRFVAGWAPDGVVDPVTDPDDYVANVPFDVKQAILFMAAHLYENRQSVALTPVRQEIQEVPSTVDDYIAPYIIPRL
jgi:uncharacterized phiE125 gp8 family phage protein